MKDDKLPVYKEALADVIKQLTQKRTEMATEAKKTLADYETKIPALAEQASTLAKTVAELDEILNVKKAESDKEEVSAKSKYDALEVKLKKTYDEKHLELVTKDEAFTKKEAKSRETLKADKKDLEHRLSVLIANQTNVLKDREQVTLDEDSLLKRWNEHNAIVTAFKSEQEEGRSTINLQKDDLKLRGKELAQKEKDFNIKELKADEAIAKVQDIEKREEALKVKQAEVRKEKEELHQKMVKDMAEQTKMNSRKAALDLFEEALNERDKNIKSIEASLVKKKG